MDKKEICIVYRDQPEAPFIAYQNEKGIIWRSRDPIPNKHNVIMSYHGGSTPSDSVMVIEPRCVSPVEYDMNHLNKFKYIFTWATNAFKNTQVAHKVIPINHPSVGGPPSPENWKDKWLPWQDRANEVVIVANNKKSDHNSELYKLRFQIADHLSRRNIKVSWFGQDSVLVPYYKGRVSDKHALLSRVKFSMCCENSYDEVYSHGYFTEKLPEVVLGGCVPIYMGCHNIDQLNIPHTNESYIDLRKYVKHNVYNDGSFENITDFDGLADHIKNYTEDDYNKFVEQWDANIKDPKGMLYEISFIRMFNTLIDTFSRE